MYFHSVKIIIILHPLSKYAFTYLKSVLPYTKKLYSDANENENLATLFEGRQI